MVADNVCILIMAHKNIDYFYGLAKANPNINFYIHYDSKFNIPICEKIDNFVFLNDSLRVDVKWGGFSQVQAMHNLFKFAFNHSISNGFFHLVSGEDLVLNKDSDISNFLKWNSDEIFMDFCEANKLRYRMRFNAYHADKLWQRNFFGKVYTKILQFFDIIFNTHNNYWAGSNWFSLKRKDLEVVLNGITNEDYNFFRNKLNPDEHFFQYIVSKVGLRDKISALGNKRYIVFDKKINNGNNPIYLKLNDINDILLVNKFFFCRKVDRENQIKYLNKEYY